MSDTDEWSRPQESPPVSILTYHQVGRFASPKSHRTNYCHVRRFRAQMAWLKAMGYNVISLDQALDGLFGSGPLPGRAVVLTFDDGYQNFYDNAFPTLKRLGFPATVFVVTGLVGRKADWLGDGQTKAPLMSGETLRELNDKGITVGSHTNTHARLSRLTDSKQRDQIMRSKTELEDLLGVRVRHFCYPYGDYDDRARHMVEEAGYWSGLTRVAGAANHANSPFEVPRKSIGYGDNLAGFFWQLHMKHTPKAQTSQRR